MENIKYVNLIEIGPVVVEVQGVENGDLVVPINDTIVCRTSFLATAVYLDSLPLLFINIIAMYLYHL